MVTSNKILRNAETYVSSTKDAATATMGAAPKNPAGNVPMGQQKPKPAQPYTAGGTHQSGSSPSHPFGDLPSSVAQPGIKPGRC